MPKGGRSMTTEEKNKILLLIREDRPRREIARLFGYDPATIIRFERNIENVSNFETCPACGKEIINYKNRPGRKRVYCSDKCRCSKKNRKVEERVCINCGNHFVTWKYKRIKYCCHSCYVEHRYGKRLQDKSS